VHNKNRNINPAHIDALLAMVNPAPYYKHLSIEVCAIEVGLSIIEIELSKLHENPFGTIHGGAYASFLDTAAYWAIYCELPENVGFTTIDLDVELLAAAKHGKLIAEGTSLKIGRSICLAEAKARDSQGKLIAYATSKLMVLENRQTIAHAVESMGHGGLPPKFLD
jgi:uncharacterized protein (TIGR00369 family)